MSYHMYVARAFSRLLLLDATAVAAAAAVAKMSLCFDAEMQILYTSLFISTYI